MGSQALLDFLLNNVEIGDTILDLGCGDKFYSNGLKEKADKIVTIDAWPATEPDILMDVTKAALPFEDKKFDVVLMIDFIEHIDKEEGLGVITEAQRVGHKVILMTPNFWTDNLKNIQNPKTVYYKNQFNLHRSLWTIEDFKDWSLASILGKRYITVIWSGS